MRTYEIAPPEQRFWKHVTPLGISECWLWVGTKQALGYGEFLWRSNPRVRVGAHVASWLVHHGAVPPDRQVNHHCDVRACVNPQHLYLGTQGDNVADAVRRGRMNPPRKLTPTQVRWVRSCGLPQKVIAAQVGVSASAISLILSGKTYSSVA